MVFCMTTWLYYFVHVYDNIKFSYVLNLVSRIKISIL